MVAYALQQCQLTPAPLVAWHVDTCQYGITTQIVEAGPPATRRKGVVCSASHVVA